MFQLIEHLSREQLLTDLEQLKFQLSRAKVGQRETIMHHITVYRRELQFQHPRGPVCCRYCGHVVAE
jgi:hypothetical protein